ncbi:MAG: penicillin-binding protein, partial [Aerococcus suis]|nr:penicillin-binding protein [Aerococcus suis]
MKKTAWKDHSFTFYLNVFFKALKRFFSIILIILLVSLLIVTGIGAGYFVGLVEDTPIPDKQEFASAINNMEEKSTLTFNNGDDIGTLRTDLVRTNIPLSDISPKVVEGLISTEDENFFN